MAQRRRTVGLEKAARQRRPSAKAADNRIRSWRTAAAEGLEVASVPPGGAYDRARALPRLIAIDPRELDRDTPELRDLIERRLKRSLRAERGRGRAGHWAYDLNRHLALLQALAGEAHIGRRTAGHSEAPERKSAARMTGRRSSFEPRRRSGA